VDLAEDRLTGPEAYLEANRALWDEWARINERSAFYDLEGFKRGGVRLKAFEVEEVGDVEGKDLLHLQCHFGIDTLSWARLGARVTGVDFSEEANPAPEDTVSQPAHIDGRMFWLTRNRLPGSYRSLSSTSRS